VLRTILARAANDFTVSHETHSLPGNKMYVARLKKFSLQKNNYTVHFFLTVAIGNCMVKLIPPVNFCSDENIQTIFGTKLEDFLNYYRLDYNSIF
jgi:hypothetical protein